MELLNVVKYFSRKAILITMPVANLSSKYLKKNRTNRKPCRTTEALRLDLFDYIEKLYNNQLPHGAIGYKTPNEYEAEYWGCTE